MATGGQGSAPNTDPQVAKIRCAVAAAQLFKKTTGDIAKQLRVAVSIVQAIKAEGESVGAVGHDDALNTNQAAWIIGVEPRRVRNFVRDGRIVPIDPESRNHKFLLAEIIRFASTPRKCGRKKKRDRRTTNSKR